MAKEWTSTKRDLPIVGEPVVASVKEGNSFYSEFLILEKDGSWSYQNGTKLEDNKIVVGWMGHLHFLVKIDFKEYTEYLTAI